MVKLIDLSVINWTPPADKKKYLRDLCPRLRKEDIEIVCSIFDNPMDFHAAVVRAISTSDALLRKRETIEKHRARMKSVARLAENLAAALRDQDDWHLLDCEDDFARISNGGLTRFQRFTEELRVLQQRAELVATDDRELKIARFENPNKRQQRHRNRAHFVWDAMFQWFQASRRKLTLSPDSELHRLIDAAHIQARLPELSYSNLDNYLSDYKRLVR